MSLKTEGKPQLVIVGNGMAAGRLLDEILKRSPDKYSITVVGDEVEGSYNRIMLSPVLAGELSQASIIQKNPQWYQAQGVVFHGGDRGVNIDTENKQLHLQSGLALRYDHLVIATGSRPATIPAKNQQLEAIYSFRTLQDVERITAAGESANHALVVGGGLLGLEAAYGLAQQNIKVTLVHRSAWPLNRQLDKHAGALLQRVMENKHIQFTLSAEVDHFQGGSRVEAAKLNNGDTIPCDLAVIATGITPNRELGADSGLHCGRGIVVDALMSTSDKNISALGECCEFDGATFGLVEPIWQQCRTLADKLCFNKQTPFINTPTATKLKVSGVQVFSAGEYLTGTDHRELTLKNEKYSIYRKLLIKDRKIVGIVFFGDTRDGQAYFRLMENKTTLPNNLSSLLLGKSFFPPFDVIKDETTAVNQ